ncbi:MAG: xanthine dehydrogenase accessory protein XdhC [Bacteriovoracia bacterium]
MEQQLDQFCQYFLRFHSEGRALVVVTMVDNRGSAPQDVGARMIVGTEGLLFGTVGGGKIEKRCLDEAQKLLASPERVHSQSFTWNLQRDIGMSCGGEVTMFFEVQRPSERWHVAIFGAGHVSQELVRVLLKLDCHLTVIDPRSEWLEKLPAQSERFKKIQTDTMAAVLRDLHPKSFVALMTMGHSFDAPILTRALKEFSFPFLGVIGSKQKRSRLEKELTESGVSPELLTSFHCPLGEAFGTNAPAEIALSMVAQLLRARDAFQGRSVSF